MSGKNRCGKWKKTQEQLFMNGLSKYGKNWKLIQKIIKTRSVPQVRSHAQKFFASLDKREKKVIEAEIRDRFDEFCIPRAQRQKKEETGEIKSEKEHSLINESENLQSKTQQPLNSIKVEQISLCSSEKDKKIIKPQYNQSFNTQIPIIGSLPNSLQIDFWTKQLEKANMRLIQTLLAQRRQISHTFCLN